jgi:hypothetical protein
VSITTSESIKQPPRSECPACGRPCPPIIVNDRGYCCASSADRLVIVASLEPDENGNLWSFDHDHLVPRVAGDPLSDAWGEPPRAKYPWTGTGYANEELVPASMLRKGGTVELDWETTLREPALAPVPSSVRTRRRGLKNEEEA